MSENHSESGIKKRLGEFLILGLYLVLDLMHVWPTHHFYALVAAVIGFAALLLLDGGFSTKQIISTLACVGTSCVVIYFTAAATERREETEIIGTLQPARDPTPPNGCDRMPNDRDTLKILIGTNGYFTHTPGKFVAIAIGREPNICRVLTIERRQDGGIAVGADLYGADGKLIARIDNGTFHAMSGDESYVERSGDLSVLTVKDAGGSELLYVKYLNQSTIRARGVFGCPGHGLVKIDDKTTGGMGMTDNCIGSPGLLIN